MALPDVLSTGGADGTTEEDTYRCIDCMASFKERHEPCPKCGSETVKEIRAPRE